MEKKRMRKVTIPSIISLPILIALVLVFAILYHNDPKTIYLMIVLISGFVGVIPLTLLVMIVPNLFKEVKSE